MSAAEPNSAYQPGGGYQPHAPRETLTPRQRIAYWIFLLGFVAWTFFHHRFPEAAAWLQLLAVPIFAFFLVRGLAFPRRGISDDEDDWQKRLTPVRRAILLTLTALFIASYAAFAIAQLAFAPDPRWAGYLLPLWLVMFCLGALAMPRDPEAYIDMRPIWSLCAIAMTAFFVIVNNIL